MGKFRVTVLIKNYKKKNNIDILNTYVEDLNYGTVAINEWSAIGFCLYQHYHGEDIQEIKTMIFKVGRGMFTIHTYFESPQKGIVYSKFKNGTNH
jgi:hypothetical protein